MSDEDAGFYDGFGLLSDRQADRIREQRERARSERKERMRRLAED